MVRRSERSQKVFLDYGDTFYYDFSSFGEKKILSQLFDGFPLGRPNRIGGEFHVKNRDF